MATIHAENYYSFRYGQPIIDPITAGSSTEATTLANIESLLTSANQSYWQRQYNDIEHVVSAARLGRGPATGQPASGSGARC